MLTELEDNYMIDLSFDEDLVPSYGNFGISKARGMFLRN